ncbi:MAG: hypothetical protein J6R67_02750 [Treponema sp.]|nr:hypothetical protein [Treponema sp.]
MKNSLDCKKLLSYGKELSIFAGILLVLLFVFSCNNILMRNSGSLVITVPGARAASASTFTIELASASGFTQRETISGGSTIQFDDLAPDTYTINVKGMDDAGNKVLSGTEKATVTAGQTATVTVELQKLLGSLTVSFEGAESDSVAEYTVILSGPNESKETQEVTDRTVQFEGLIPGDYTVSVLGQDSAGTIVLSGTEKATVVEGQTVTATVPLQDKIGKLSVAFTVPDGSIAQSYTVEITHSEDKEFSKEETISNGTSVLFEGLIPGEYTITVNGINADTVVLYGSVKATVVEGQTVPATVPLQKEVGRLSVTLTVPDGSIAQSYTVEITHSEDKEFSKEETISDGTSVLFNDLIPGSYTISVQGMNADTVVLYGTTTTNEVGKGEESPATVNLAGVVNNFDELETAISNGGTVYVGSSIEISETIKTTNSDSVTIQAVSEGVELSLPNNINSQFSMFEPTSGEWTFGGGEHTITLVGGSYSASIINISSTDAEVKVTLTSNGSINIKNSSGIAVAITSTSSTNESVFHLDGGTIEGSASGSNVIEVNTGGQFIMTSGSITATADKGVYVNGGSFSMTGGNILNSTSGVFVKEPDLFTISGNVQVGTIRLSGIGVYFTVGGILEGNSTVATITPGRYNAEEVVVKVAEGSDVTLAEVATRFNVAPNGNIQWAIDPNTGKLVQQ